MFSKLSTSVCAFFHSNVRRRRPLQSFPSAALAFFALSATQLMADFIPPSGLAPGSQYEILFVTAGTTAATSSDISYYNSFVNAQAALNPSLPSTTWNAIVSTPTVNASVNAPYIAGVPIFNIFSQQISDGTQDFYASESGNSGLSGDVGYIWYDQFGNFMPATPNLYHGGSVNNWVWTGSWYTGTPKNSSGPLGGGTFAEVGSESGPFYGNNWIANTGDFTTAFHPVFALSDPITVPGVPEPSSFALFGLGGIGLAFGAYRRRRMARRLNRLV